MKYKIIAEGCYVEDESDYLKFVFMRTPINNSGGYTEGYLYYTKDDEIFYPFIKSKHGKWSDGPLRKIADKLTKAAKNGECFVFDANTI